ncbi:polysaccharide pyruvyl transferase family protein [Dubosiella newyorkensis]|uniref:polysaccharide pyruvyl transferase family protein n=1 Tax=Dubosiella newyorkensis TaxID=1862672 RepID=UPI0025845D83|nr:polysaccharide pyruvyl transferase family protein [Dubosiella newyorkensis]
MNIYVQGFFYSNLGDDLFLKILANRYKNHNFYVVTEKKYSKAFENIKNIHIYRYNKLNRLISKFNIFDYYTFVKNKCSTNVIIGGSLFQETIDTKNAFKRLKSFPTGEQTFLIGINFGPYKTNAYIDATKTYLSKVKDACFRDDWSYNFFKDLSNVRYSTDVVFNLEGYISPKKTNKQVFVSVMDFSNNENELDKTRYEEFLLKCINKYITLGYKIILSSFCAFQGDPKAIDRIINKINNDLRSEISVLNYDGNNLDCILNSINSSEMIIATRFHSLILGILFNKPVVPIIYNNKTRIFLESIQKENYGLYINNISEEIQVEDYLLKIEDVELKNLKELSKRQFLGLDNYLNKMSQKPID